MVGGSGADRNRADTTRRYDVLEVETVTGGVGLCEYVQHLAIFDYLRVGSRWTDG